MIKSAKYIKSSTELSQSPNTRLPEYALIGRSNVGKSSLINTLSDNKSLAKVSKTPGKTRLINYFLCENKYYLVDLPGYGYAKASKKIRGYWGGFIEKYILNNEKLKTLFILIDSSIPPQKIDLKFILWVGDNDIPFTIIFTKTDKAKQQDISNNIRDFKKEIVDMFDSEPNYFRSSAVKKQGPKEIVQYINFLTKNTKA